MYYIIGVLVIGILIYMRPFIFAPEITGPAVKKFALDMLRNKMFDELIKGGETNFEFNRKKVYAHWRSFKEGDAWTVEFDAHPGDWNITLSTSHFVGIKDEEHLKQIKNYLLTSDDFVTAWKETIGK